ncbi:MAG TPA: chemotaxis-specific protein-glutamate methyltransferase CheB [Polyangiales bacterium]|nr:chemotaxis-specific protein-glutamate methyltransferase CheB [Polyangiales bacterium]
MRPLRVLVVDDSAVNRRTIADLLGQMPGVTVIGVAQDGDEALRYAASMAPDMITLDLEMPRMDGFTFLRLLMASRPAPVVVVSSHSAKENVFRALELGALDFIAKPDTYLTSQATGVREQLDAMVSMVRQLAPARAQGRRSALPRQETQPNLSMPPDHKRVSAARLMVIAASTGGPTALLDIFSQLPPQSDTAIVVAQHMPERFTKAFADRLARASQFRVREAEGTQELFAAEAWVCPGGKSVEIETNADGRSFARVVDALPSDRYAPSADRLFRSAARGLGKKVTGVVLTGMGDDGAAGVVEIKNAGGQVFVESEETAVIYGMPRCAKQTGVVDEVWPLQVLVARLAALVGKPEKHA